jgi:hypothetical protein
MPAPIADPATPRDKTPYIESEALKKKLTGVMVTASTYPNGRAVPVSFVGPDFELKSASYPGIYLSYAGMSRASEREHRGATNLQYAPPGFPANVQVPKDIDNKDSTETEAWNLTFDRRTSPYTVYDYPIPYNLDFNVTVVSRNYQQMFEVISQLDEISRISSRFGGLEVPEDGTVRTLELLGGPDTSSLRDEDGKRLLQSVYSVRVAAEISLYDVESVQRVLDVNVQTSSTIFTL